MPNAVDQTRFVERFLCQHALQVRSDFVLVFPVGNVFLQVFLHGIRLQVRTAVTRALHRANGRRIRRIRIGVGRAQHVRSKRGVVAAAVFHVNAQHDIQHTCFHLGKLTVGAQHGQNGFRR